MAARRTLRALHPAISWQQTGKPQKTIASAVERSGTGLHTGAPAAVRLLPAPAGEGRSFALTADSVEVDKIPASIDRVVECRLCTSLCSGSARVSTIEHLMSALEGCGVDNVRVEIGGGFEIERLRSGGLIQGGSLENAIICSIRDGWINPPLRFDDEPCRHKILDLIGDLSLLSENGNQGLPVAHLVAYKAGHALHARFASMLKSRMMRHGDHANQISAKWQP